MRLNRVFSNLDPWEYSDEELDLDCEFVPLRGSNEPLTIKCPMCGLIMTPIPNGLKWDYFCLECGILG